MIIQSYKRFRSMAHITCGLTIRPLSYCFISSFEPSVHVHHLWSASSLTAVSQPRCTLHVCMLHRKASRHMNIITPCPSRVAPCHLQHMMHNVSTCVAHRTALRQIKTCHGSDSGLQSLYMHTSNQTAYRHEQPLACALDMISGK